MKIALVQIKQRRFYNSLLVKLKHLLGCCSVMHCLKKKLRGDHLMTTWESTSEHMLSSEHNCWTLATHVKSSKSIANCTNSAVGWPGGSSCVLPRDLGLWCACPSLMCHYLKNMIGSAPLSGWASLTDEPFEEHGVDVPLPICPALKKNTSMIYSDDIETIASLDTNCMSFFICITIAMKWLLLEARRLVPGGTCRLEIPCSTWIFMLLDSQHTWAASPLSPWLRGDQHDLREDQHALPSSPLVDATPRVRHEGPDWYHMPPFTGTRNNHWVNQCLKAIYAIPATTVL